MKSLIIAVAFCISTGVLSGQQISPAFHGMWTLNVEKSDFGRTSKPKAGLVNWGEHGWVFSVATADGRVFADAVVTDGGGCKLVGAFPSELSCKIEIVSPRHVRFTLFEGELVRRIGDIELLSDDTTQTTHRITPSKGASYVEKTIWEKQTTDPFVGIWKFLPEQSRFAGRQPEDIRLRFVIDNGRLREEEETVRSDGSMFTGIFLHEYDGEEHPFAISGETKHRTHTARWTRIDERTIERRINHDNGKQYTTERLTLSPDLKTLTETHFGTGSDGRPYETAVETFVRN